MNNKGLTLVELLIALAVSALIMVGVYATVNMTQLTSSGMEGRIIAQQDVRAALDLMALEIRMASYDSYLNNTIWRNPADCTTASGNPTYKGIQAATANSITIQMDINDNGVINNDPEANPNENITYTYEAADLRITRETNCGDAQPFIGDTAASPRPRVVRIVNDLNGNNAFDADTEVPLFRYFDHNNVPIAPANFPANIPLIRTIEISIVAETENRDPATKKRKRIVYSLRVSPKNHGLNP